MGFPLHLIGWSELNPMPTPKPTLGTGKDLGTSMAVCEEWRDVMGQFDRQIIPKVLIAKSFI